MTDPKSSTAGADPAAGRVIRHAGADRVFHWLTAGCVLILMATAFLPILGFKFTWIDIHWITGLVLIAAVVFHVFRVLFKQGFRAMWIDGRDFGDAAAIARATLRRDADAYPKPGKYSFAQKLIHHAFALVVLTAAGTGAAMLLRIDTPWWKRNPYLLGDGAWGVVYVLHGLAALTLITMVMLHVYFALRPEKLLFTRAMLRGWITRKEYAEHHDPQRWQVER